MKKRNFTFIQYGECEIWTSEDIIDNANYILQEMDCYNEYENYTLKHNEDDLEHAFEIISNSLVDYELEEII